MMVVLKVACKYNGVVLFLDIIINYLFVGRVFRGLFETKEETLTMKNSLTSYKRKVFGLSLELLKSKSRSIKYQQMSFNSSQ